MRLRSLGIGIPYTTKWGVYCGLRGTKTGVGGSSPLLERARHPAGAASQYAILSYCLFAVGEGSRV